MPLRLHFGDGRRDRLRLGERIAENGRTDVGNALGRGRSSHHREVRGFCDRKCLERFTGKRRAHHERRRSVGREFLHEVDDLRAVARCVLHVEREVGAAGVDDARLDVLGREVVGVLLHRAIDGSRTGDVGDDADFDGFSSGGPLVSAAAPGRATPTAKTIASEHNSVFFIW